MVGNVTRRMNLVSTEGMSDPKVPNLTLPARITVTVDELQRGIKAAESISDHVALNANTEGFEMVSDGDTDSGQLEAAQGLAGRPAVLGEHPLPVPHGLLLDHHKGHTERHQRQHQPGQRPAGHAWTSTSLAEREASDTCWPRVSRTIRDANPSLSRSPPRASSPLR
ncbi:MAG: hypothetical protein MZV70_43680 [Desulfobacterales bacterium]|nr:hypothetical protein [Desulfobacterales bacterium]